MDKISSFHSYTGYGLYPVFFFFLRKFCINCILLEVNFRLDETVESMKQFKEMENIAHEIRSEHHHNVQITENIASIREKMPNNYNFATS